MLEIVGIAKVVFIRRRCRKLVYFLHQVKGISEKEIENQTSFSDMQVGHLCSQCLKL